MGGKHQGREVRGAKYYSLRARAAAAEGSAIGKSSSPQ